MKKSMFRNLLIPLMLLFFSFTFLTPVLAAEEGAPTISAAPIVIGVGDTYDPLAGLVVTDDIDSEADLLANVTYSDWDVDISTPGAYIIYYDVFDSDGHRANLRRNVVVLGPDLPIIAPNYLIVEYNTVFDPKAGVYSFDQVDGDITASINVLENNVDTSLNSVYLVTYEVTDSDMNRVEMTITVYVEFPVEYYPSITAPNQMLKVGDVYDPLAGVTATDMTDGDLTGVIEIEYSCVDTSRPGVYYTDYRVVNSFDLYGSATRIVVVFDMTTSPSVISEDYHFETGMEFDPKAGIYAFDLEDGDLTASIEVVVSTVDMSHAGEYYVIYRVQDSDGNFAEYTRTIIVEWSWDLMPFIQVDPYMVFLPLDASFDPMQGVSVIDPTDGDITDKITVESNVDTSKPGEYVVTYMITNSLGITNGNQRILYVFDSSVPIIRAYDFESPIGQEIDIYSAHFEAYDLEDGDIWESIVLDTSAVDINTVGTYPVIVSITDSDGNMASTTCYVTIKDPSYPELYADDYTVYLDSVFNPLEHVYAWDNMDGEITDQIIVTENTVKIKKLGMYSVTYSVTNSQGKTATKTVNVEVAVEPVFEQFLTYDGNLFLLESDATGYMAFITPHNLIPAGAEVGLAIYADGEPWIEFGGYIIINELLPGFTYSLESDGDRGIIGTILPYLYNGAATRYTASEAEIAFKSTVDGEFYYAVADMDSGMPEIDTTGEGIAATAGTNTFRIDNLKPGVKPQVVYVVLKAAGGELTNILSIDVPTIPSPPNNGKKPENPGKPNDMVVELEVIEEVEEPKTNKGQDKKEDPAQVPVIEEPKTNNGQEKKVEAPVVESAAVEPKNEKGLGQEKKEEEITAQEVVEEVPMSPDAELIDIPDDEKDKDKEKKADENIELLEEKSNNGKSDKG